MTPEKHLVLPMYPRLYAFLMSTALGEDTNKSIELFDVIFSICKLMTFSDINGIDKEIRNYYISLHESNINLPINELNTVIRECSLIIMKELVANDLIDYIHYIVDYSESRLVVRAYRLDRNINYNKGVEHVI